MKKFMKSIAVSTIGFLTIMLYIGCTPGKAQTRANDYKGNFGTEEYEAFDTDDNAGDDTIPKYSNNSGNNVSSKNVYNNNNKNQGYSSSNYSGNSNGNIQIRPVKSTGYDGSNQKSNNGFDVVNYKNSTTGTTDYVRSTDNSNQYRSDRFYQKGTASWYGREFHGKVTASGERFNMNNYTAAHKTLPFGTILEVRNLQNGKRVRIKINDRGPYRGNRIIDLSYAAAKELSMVGTGTAQVGINVIKMGDNARNFGNNSSNRNRYVEPVSDRDISRNNSSSYNSYDNSNNKNYNSDSGYVDSSLKLQAGAFYSRNNAEKLRARIEVITNKQVRIVSDGDFFKVMVEGFVNTNEAEQVKNSLYNDRISSFIVK